DQPAGLAKTAAGTSVSATARPWAHRLMYRYKTQNADRKPVYGSAIGSGPPEDEVQGPAPAGVGCAVPQVVEQRAVVEAAVFEGVGQDRQPVEREVGGDPLGDRPGGARDPGAESRGRAAGGAEHPAGHQHEGVREGANDFADAIAC